MDTRITELRFGSSVSPLRLSAPRHELTAEPVKKDDDKMLPICAFSARACAPTAATIAMAASLLAPLAAAQKEDPKEILAVQLRKQGHACKKPLEAERDASASKPDEAVWILRCDTARYRIRLRPDMAADISKLD